MRFTRLRTFDSTPGVGQQSPTAGALQRYLKPIRDRRSRCTLFAVHRCRPRYSWRLLTSVRALFATVEPVWSQAFFSKEAGFNVFPFERIYQSVRPQCSELQQSDVSAPSAGRHPGRCRPPAMPERCRAAAPSASSGAPPPDRRETSTLSASA